MKTISLISQNKISGIMPNDASTAVRIVLLSRVLNRGLSDKVETT